MAFSLQEVMIITEESKHAFKFWHVRASLENWLGTLSSLLVPSGSNH
jgi:hypothetical protein